MSTTTQTSLKAYFGPVKSHLESVKASLLAIVPPESQVLTGTVSSSLTSGGKYMRPAVALLASLATAPEIDQRHIETAAVAEMIHIATLLHDDVLDDADLRRGKTTVRAQFGNKISVLSGDFLLAQASLKLSKLGNTRLVAIYAQVLADLCDGEVEQMTASYKLETADLKPLWHSYYHKTYCKTASLFSAGCESAGVINTLPEDQIEHLKSFGRAFGIAFQIVDDLLDFTSTEAEMGKPVLDDLRNGHLNAPVLFALEPNVMPETEREALVSDIRYVFDTPGGDDADGHILAIKSRLETAGVIEKTARLAGLRIEQATRALDFVPDCPAKASLIGLAELVLDRRQ